LSHDDATILRAHQHSAGARKKNGEQAIGRSRGELTTKIHVLVDAPGNPVEVKLTLGQVHDLTGAEPLLEGVDPEALIGDKAYDADPLRGDIVTRRLRATGIRDKHRFHLGRMDLPSG
jgi:hypothetical protein